MTTALQLGLVVVVWLLALIPAAIAALAVLIYKLVRGSGAAKSTGPDHRRH